MQSLKKSRILVVRREESSRRAIARVLEGENYDIIEAGTAAEALELVDRKMADLVLIGPDLIDLRPVQLCRQIKEKEQGSIPVILTSQEFTPDARVQALRVGAQVCLPDPSDASELIAQVASLCHVREVARALGESEERFRLATEAMRGLVYEWDISRDVSQRSAGMAEFLGWRPDEAPTHGDWWPEQFHPEDAPTVHRTFAEAAARHANDCQLEYRIRHRAGHYLWVWDTSRIVYGADGKPTRVIGCVVSIDERKRAEQELRLAKEELARLNEGLEVKVEKRTRKLKEAVAELESWSYSIAHDMRAPLRTMHSFSYFLLNEYGCKLDTIARDYLERIDAATHRLDDYLRDLLHYGKMGGGELPVTSVDTTSLIGEILATYPNFQPPKCSIDVKLPLPPVQANPSALTQVFSNLLDNAVKFSRKGTLPQVRIWAEEKETRVRLWIEDNGIGIQKQAQPRLFAMFQRLHVSSDYEGTGMGLAIVRRAVERMGGAVGVESEPDRGSKFWVELKAA
jgi:PAS domain S-box-containing protein